MNKCEQCGLKLKENTDGKKGYCQGHDYKAPQKPALELMYETLNPLTNKYVKVDAKKLNTSQRIKTNKPIEIWKAGDWFWFVYKKYQKPEMEAKNEYSRWFTKVYTPMCPDGELGDTYVKDVKQYATMFYEESDPKYNSPEAVKYAMEYNNKGGV